MSTIQISNQAPFGSLTNRTTGSLLSNHTNLERLQSAVATANAGYEGVPGAQFEGMGSMFGVTADPANPGQNGTDYAYAVEQLQVAFAAFWTAALPYIQQLDNGVQSM
jgi:hypothetical protein